MALPDREAVKDLLTFLFTPSPTVFALGFLVIFLGPILLHFIQTSAIAHTALPSILLLGPPNGGKTALLTLFERGPKSASSSVKAPVTTHTSSAPQSVELAITDHPTATSSFRDDLDATGATHRKFLLVDTPGHPKLRRDALAYLSDSPPPRALVFVVDAAALSDPDALAPTASYLYDVLLALQKRVTANKKGSKAPPQIPVLVAANKLDLFTALPAALVRSHLEAELGRIRATRSKGLPDSGVGADDLDDSEDADDWLGQYGSEKFSFKQMAEFDVEVEVLGGNVTGEGPGPDKWWRWIGERL